MKSFPHFVINHVIDSGVKVSVLIPQVRKHHWIKYLMWIIACPAIIILEWNRETNNYSWLVINNDTWISKGGSVVFSYQNLENSVCILT